MHCRTAVINQSYNNRYQEIKHRESMTASADLFLRFGISLAIGFLIGLQREYAFREKKRDLLAGERTFALMALVGSLAAMIADIFDSSLSFLGIIFLAGIFYCSRIFY